MNGALGGDATIAELKFECRPTVTSLAWPAFVSRSYKVNTAHLLDEPTRDRRQVPAIPMSHHPHPRVLAARSPVVEDGVVVVAVVVQCGMLSLR